MVSATAYVVIEQDEDELAEWTILGKGFIMSLLMYSFMDYGSYLFR
jgi:hypothetical protein